MDLDRYSIFKKMTTTTHARCFEIFYVSVKKVVGDSVHTVLTQSTSASVDFQNIRRIIRNDVWQYIHMIKYDKFKKEELLKELLK